MQIETIFNPFSQQAVFRQLVEAVSRPGSICNISNALDSAPAYRAVLASLLDNEVTFSDHDGLLADTDWPLFQANKADSDKADFVLCSGENPPTFEPNIGSLPNPEQSATLILIVLQIGEGNMTLHMKGPGVRNSCQLAVAGLHPDWLHRRMDWVCSFPMGVDLILTDQSHFAAIPRTTRLEVR